MNYITRERVHVDRIATAWAIRRFIDAEATFQWTFLRMSPRTQWLRAFWRFSTAFATGAQLMTSGSHADSSCVTRCISTARRIRLV